jgi:hypothetical protein
MLLNSDLKSNIFSWIYLGLSCYFILSENKKDIKTVAVLNNISVIMI